MKSTDRPIECCATPIIPLPLSADAETMIVTRFKALGDPTRFAIFRLVAAQPEPICACDVVARFDLSQPTISHHMKILHDAGLITVSRRGVWAYYAVAPDGVASVARLLSGLVPGALVATG